MRNCSIFIGHYAPALIAASQKKAPGLGLLFVAAQFADYLFGVFLLTGAEHMRFLPNSDSLIPVDLYDMPFSHSLLGTVVVAAIFAVPVYLYYRKIAAALLAGAVVLSHWFIDILVHPADLTLAGSPPKLGLDLWAHPAAAILLELALIGAAFFYYVRATRPPFRQSTHRRVFILAGVLLALQLVNWFGPEGSDSTAFAYVMIAVFSVTALLAEWAGRGRRPRPFRRQRFH